jgi:hypothetical protein
MKEPQRIFFARGALSAIAGRESGAVDDSVFARNSLETKQNILKKLAARPDRENCFRHLK